MEAGEGPAVLLLHGLGSSLDTWRRNVQPLADAGYRVLAPDLPGHGDSDKPVSLDYDPLATVDFTSRLLDALGVRKASLVGNSAGGLVATMFALEHPERTGRLALVAPGGLGRQISWFLRLMSVPAIGEFLYHPWTYHLMGINKRVFHEPSSVPDGVLTETARVHALPGSIRATIRSLRSSINLKGVRPERQVLDRPPIGGSSYVSLGRAGQHDPGKPLKLNQECHPPKFGAHIASMRALASHGEGRRVQQPADSIPWGQFG